PLAPIRSANEVLHQQSADQNRVLWAHGVINRQLTHLVRLVDDLLDVSRLTLGKIRLSVEMVELEAIIAHAVEDSRPLIDKFRHRLEATLPTQPVWLHGDPARLIQVFGNLLNNAAKYTDSGGQIVLSAELGTGGSDRNPEEHPADASSAWVTVRLRDT